MAHARTAAVALATLALALPLAAASPATAADKVTAIAPGLTKVNLLNINDFHGRIDGGSLDGTLGKQVACTIADAKATLGADATAFLSAGDNVGATTFVSSSANDEPTLAYLNALSLRASAVGNHEFDQGWGDLSSRIQPHATFPYLGANVYQRGTTTPVLPEYQVITLNGVRVGVIGAVTQQTPQMVSPLGVSGLDFGDPVAAVNRVADKLVAGNLADVIVAEYHEGAANGASTSSLAGEVAGNPVFAHIVNDTSPKVAVIFNGHTHAVYTWDAATASGTRSVSESGSYGAFVGQLQLGIDPATKTVQQYAMTNIDTTAKFGIGSNDSAAVKTAKVEKVCATNAEYRAAASIVDAAVAKANVVGAKVIGHVSADITRAYKDASWVNGVVVGKAPDDRLRESTLSNLEAQVWLEAMNVPSRPGADIGVQNPGGVRADLMYKQSNGEGDGNVTYAEAASVNPFANTLGTVTISGAELKTLLEQQWQPAGSSRLFLNLGLSKNVRWTFDETLPQGSKVTGVWVNDLAVLPTDSFRVATNSFLAAGGDNFFVLGKTAAGTSRVFTDSGQIDMDAFITWLTNAGSVAPDFHKLGVEVESPSVVRDAGYVTVTALVQGTDLTSLGSPRNTSFDVLASGKKVDTVTINPVHVAGLPTLDGQAKVALKLKISTLKGLNRDSELVLVAQPTGTKITFTIKY